MGDTTGVKSWHGGAIVFMKDGRFDGTSTKSSNESERATTAEEEEEETTTPVTEADDGVETIGNS